MVLDEDDDKASTLSDVIVIPSSPSPPGSIIVISDDEDHDDDVVIIEEAAAVPTENGKGGSLGSSPPQVAESSRPAQSLVRPAAASATPRDRPCPMSRKRIKIEEEEEGEAADTAVQDEARPPKTKRAKKERQEDDDDDDEVAASSPKSDSAEKDDGQQEDDAKSNNSDEGEERDEEDLYGRCRHCHQRLSTVTARPGAPLGALSEVLALQDPRLLVEGRDHGEMEYYYLTDFCVFDGENHLVQLDAGLIESDKKIFFCGAVNPICCVDPKDSDTAVWVTKSGAIEGWWITALQGGGDDDDKSSSPVIGITTKEAEYCLQVPNKIYEPFLKELYDKCILTKLVMETAGTTYEEAMDLDYEELVAKMTQDAPQAGLPMFSAEELLRNAEFVVNQIMSFDDAGDDDEPRIIMQAPCLQQLASYAGLQGDFGKDRHERAAGRVKKSKKQPVASSFSKATTTPLVKHVFKMFFPNQIKRDDKKKQQGAPQPDSKCGVCAGCLKRNCGTCKECKTMVKFGGEGRRKATCLQRRCHRWQKPNDIEGLVIAADKVKRQRQDSFRWEFSDELTKKGDITYYGTVLLIKDSPSSSVSSSEIELSVGDFALVRPDEEGQAFFVAQILSLSSADSSGKESAAHVRFFARGADTVLGETGDEMELFSLVECEDIEIFEVVRKVSVSFAPTPDNWYTLGGSEEAVASVPSLHGEQYWFKSGYTKRYARFETVDYDRDCEEVLQKAKVGDCRLCQVIGEERTRSEPKFVDFEIFTIHGDIFKVGDAMFLSPESYEMPCAATGSKGKSTENSKSTAKVDESIYTEHYRYQSSRLKGVQQQMPDPFHIGVLEEISFDEEDENKDNLMLKVRKIYRPENTGMDSKESSKYNLNHVFWSHEFVLVHAELVEGKCCLRPREVLTKSVEEWNDAGRHRFYFEKTYNADTGEMEELNRDVLERYSDGTRFPEDEGAYRAIRRPLRTLDVFAGCGGLSLGLEQSGVSRSLWAIENFPPAAEAFARNHPECTVLTEDCNLILQNAMDGHRQNKRGQRIPAKGEVELIAGGPPCQGFSMMNNFTEREYSQFKNSLISTYLSYCEYYRPKFFILENVMNFASFKKNLVLKLCLRSLVLMGYQCTFGILQAGSFGAPQTRRRCILLAAAPDQTLPSYPEPDFVFSKLSLVVNVENKMFNTNCRWVKSAPYHSTTIRDALSDLPLISNDATGGAGTMQYLHPPQTPFQRMVRGKTSVLRDHVCRKQKPLIEARISLIPLDPGSDWRDLPNKVHTLSDGTSTEKLVYDYHDYTHPAKSPKRGVCACATGKHAKCDPSWMHPTNTLIPWSYPHTARRHGNWAGQYGRLNWEGFFSTTVTNPDPMSKQGRVIHPEQHRVVSVRECARSQGFPDGYHFAGDIMDKYRQIGNAVPPPMALAIGRELLNVVKSQ